jgi:hypothetical protein
MASSKKVNQKRRGRPATGRDPVSAVRLPADLTASVDRWAEDHDANRSEAIRRLVEIGLTFGATKSKQSPAARAERANELASVAIDELGDRTAHPDERAQRHRRLTKGPEEFRDIRVDREKAKGK